MKYHNLEYTSMYIIWSLGYWIKNINLQLYRVDETLNQCWYNSKQTGFFNNDYQHLSAGENLQELNSSDWCCSFITPLVCASPIVHSNKTFKMGHRVFPRLNRHSQFEWLKFWKSMHVCLEGNLRRFQYILKRVFNC